MLFLVHLPVIPLFDMISGWGKTEEVSFHWFLDNKYEGYFYWYLYPYAAYVPHAGCLCLRYLNFSVGRDEFWAVEERD